MVSKWRDFFSLLSHLPSSFHIRSISFSLFGSLIFIQSFWRKILDEIIGEATITTTKTTENIIEYFFVTNRSTCRVFFRSLDSISLFSHSHCFIWRYWNIQGRIGTHLLTHHRCYSLDCLNSKVFFCQTRFSKIFDLGKLGNVLRMKVKICRYQRNEIDISGEKEDSVPEIASSTATIQKKRKVLQTSRKIGAFF